MAGVLSFTLGLEASKFLSGLGFASGGILSLAGAMQGLNAIAQGVWAAIERGGALTDLSNRTGESVKDLYQLQEAFKVVGLGADNVSPMLLRLQRSLSGVDESGEKTDRLFSSLGLDMEKLRVMDAPKQFEALASALNKLPKEQAAGLSGKIFGREGTGNFLQIMRDFEGYRASLRDTAAAAAVVARTAAAFDKIGDTITTIKMKIGGMFAGIGEGVAKPLQAILDAINRFDFVGLGQRIATAFSVIFEAFKSGNLSQLLTLSLKVGFEEATTFAVRLAMSLAAAIQVALPPAIQAAMDAAGQGLGDLVGSLKYSLLMIAKEKHIDTLEQIRDTRPGSWTATQQKDLEMSEQELAAMYNARNAAAEERRKQLVESVTATSKALAEVLPKAVQAARDIWEKTAPGGDTSDTRKKLDELIARMLTGAKLPDAGGNKRADGAGVVNQSMKEVSDWEKMGLVLGGGSGAVDYARETSRGVTRLVRVAELQLKALELRATELNFSRI